MATISRFDISKLDVPKFDDSSTGAGGGGGGGADDVTFNDYGLLNSDVFVQDIVYSGATRDLVSRAYPRAHGEYAETVNFRRTSIALKGALRKTTQTLLETEMDTMRKNFAVENGVLKVPWKGGSRYFDCYAAGLETLFAGRKGYHVTHVPWEIELICLHPFARDNSRETYAGASSTSSSTTYEPSNSGNAPTEMIVDITLTVAGTVSELSVENTTTGEKMTISGSFSDGDLITINTEDRTVLKNSTTALDYTGVFPTANAGTNSLTVTIETGSGQTLSLNERHYARYY